MRRFCGILLGVLLIAACMGALLFALHPVQVESVAWISESRGLLAAVFSLLAIWNYVRFVDRWAEVAEKAWREGGDIANALTERFGGAMDHVSEEHRAKAETLNGIHSNAAGLKRWLETTKGSDPSHPHPH